MSTNANLLKVKVDEAKSLLPNIGDNEEAKSKYFALKDEIANLKIQLDEEKALGDLEADLSVPMERKTADAFEPAKVADRARPLTLGEQFIESDAYKSSIKEGAPVQHKHTAFEGKGFLFGTKATFTSTATGLDTTVNYQTGPILVEQQRLTIRDLLSVGQTTLAAIPYIKETSFTNAATTVAEEGLKPEATFATEPATAPVRKIAVIGRVTDEMYSDYPMLRDYINTRLRFMVQQREEAQLLSGAGTGSTITGILNTTGILTQAQGTDTNADAIHKAITKIRTDGQFEPDGIVMHPTDWQLLRLAKDANNQYYGGGPFTGAYGNGPFMNVERYWGLPVVVTTAITAGTALVGAFRLGAQIWQREGINVATTDTDGEDWRYNRIAIRVEERLALCVYRPKAFCTVTSID